VRLTKDSAQELAAHIVRAGEVDAFRPRIAPVVDAILQRRAPARVEKLADSSVAAVWHEGLAEIAEQALDRLDGQAQRALEQIEAARVEVVRPVTDNRLARMLVIALGLRTAHETRELRIALAATEAELRELPSDRHRLIALRRAGAVVATRGDIPDAELTAAVVRIHGALPDGFDERLDLVDSAARALAGLLASDERRATTRTAAEELAAFACGGLPLLKSALDELLDEPVPEAADEDDVWVATVISALAYMNGIPAFQA
jgi:hypothetical protein